MKKRFFSFYPALLLGLVCFCAFFFALYRRNPPPLRRVQWVTMGTIAAVQGAHPVETEEAGAVCAKVFTAAENVFSAWSPESELSRVNQTAGKGTSTALSPSMQKLLADAFLVCWESDGAFNPLIGPVMAVWGFNGNTRSSQKEPDPAALREALRLADWRRICFSEAGKATFSLPSRGMKLDLGAIAKGYAVDLAYAELCGLKKKDLLIDLGGNLRALGESVPGKGGWRTGVRNPFRKEGLAARFLLRDGEATASSGNYERFVTIGNVRYSHIMDGRTGRPATGIAGTTVVAPTAEVADALSTTLFLLGPQEGKMFLKRYPGCRALWIPDTPECPVLLLSDGWYGEIEPVPPFSLPIREVRP